LLTDETNANTMQIHFIDSIHRITANDWDSLCPDGYPFIRHAFLAALEDSESTTVHTGWQPQHLLVYEQDRLIAAMPGYIKTHSYGEYVFDWGWADAYRRHGVAYYPKWISAIPFTPCYGVRLLQASSLSPTTKRQLLSAIINGLEVHVRTLSLSGWHCLFPTPTESEQLTLAGITQRLGCQFHWHNKEYSHFDDFVAGMHSRKRKNILKERKRVIEQGFCFRTQTGNELSAEDWDIFYQLYRHTYLKRSGHSGYLNADFFRQLGKQLPNNIVLITARQHAQLDTVIAASLYLRDKDTLYGRYWGCFAEYDFLHFETCYYQGIDYAIAEGLLRFDGGAQGEHKIARGFEPTKTYSNHWISHPQFRQAIEDFVQQEKISIDHYLQEAAALLPFKTTPDVEQPI